MIQSYFEIFDIEANVALDLEQLDLLYYQKISNCADAKEASYINKAYSVLKNKPSRIGHFLQLKFNINNIEENIHTYLESEFLLFIIDFNQEIDVLLGNNMIDTIKVQFEKYLNERYLKIKQLLNEDIKVALQPILSLYAEIQFLENMRLKTNEKIKKI